MKDIKLNFEVPIKENAFFNNEFLIKGTAISSTITDTNHKFLPEELDKAALTMTGIPLLVDHDNRVDSVIGKVKQGFFDNVSQNIEFEASVSNKSVQEKIKEGIVNSVSIGATVEELAEEDGTFVPKGIKIRELSVVAVPADPNAKFEVVSNAPNFQMALTQALKLSKPGKDLSDSWSFITDTSQTTGQAGDTTLNSNLPDNGSENVRRLVDMEKEKELTELKTQLAEQEAKLAKFEAKERSTLEEKYSELCKSKKVDAVEVKEATNEMLDLLITQVSGIKEADVDETPVAEEVKEEVKEEKVADEEGTAEDVETEDVEEKSSYNIFQTADSDVLTGRAFTVEFKAPMQSNYV